MRNTKIKQTFAVKAYGHVYIILRSQFFFHDFSPIVSLKAGDNGEIRLYFGPQ